MTGVLKAINRPDRLQRIRARTVVSVDLDTPLGVVECHCGDGVGPPYILITMLGDMKVGVSMHDDYFCRPLGPDPLCYGIWRSFASFQETPFVEGRQPGMMDLRGKTWKLRCYAPDGTLVWVPVPSGWADADSEPGRRLSDITTGHYGFCFP